jgi:hypothetical protein
MPTIAFCPTHDGEHPLAAAARNALTRTPIVVPAPAPDARWVAHTAGSLASTSDALVLVLHGEQAVHAAAIGFARKALRRPAVAYVLTDPRMPEFGGDYGDWPDAPVTVVLSDQAPDFALDAANQARLRGWTVVHTPLVDLLAGF